VADPPTGKLDPPDLTGTGEVGEQRCLGVPAQFVDRRQRTQGSPLQQPEGRFGDRVEGTATRQRDEPACRRGVTVDSRPDEAGVCEVEQHRGGEYPLATGLVQARLSRRVVQQQQ